MRGEQRGIIECSVVQKISVVLRMSHGHREERSNEDRRTTRSKEFSEERSFRSSDYQQVWPGHDS